MSQLRLPSCRSTQLQGARDGAVEGEHRDEDECAVESVQERDVAGQEAAAKTDDLEEDRAIRVDRVAQSADLRS